MSASPLEGSPPHPSPGSSPGQAPFRPSGAKRESRLRSSPSPPGGEDRSGAGNGASARFPVFLNLAGKRVVLIGGGGEAAAKARLLLPAAPELHVFADDAGEELHEMAAAGAVTLHRCAPAVADLFGARLCIVALNDNAAAEAACALAREAGVLVNAVDRPDLCDFIIPALVERTPVTIAIGTDGAAPALARDLRARVEAAVPPGYAALAALCRAWRPEVMRRLQTRESRRRFWDGVIAGPEAAAALDGDIERAAVLLRARLDAVCRGAAPPARGRVSLVGAGPGDLELLTLRAVRALKSADVVLYDALIDRSILGLARRDARRIDVGKRCGRHAMRQEAINRLIVRHAQAGAHVVRLKGGDPFVFGRGGEELEELRAAGIAVEVIPGITAACAAAARLGIPLTHREVARTLHFVTGHGSDGPVPGLDWRALAAGDGTIAAYMAGHTIDRVAARLIAAGLDAATPAVAIENASRPGERHIRAPLALLPSILAEAGFEGPTLVLIGRVVGLARQAEAELRVAA
ncbi:MAG TPA: siroheme synthase CysG [Acetobacteraceae bacterium]|nr:siroheme synthase CysG [Acetobacteraceae bacterium]